MRRLAMIVAAVLALTAATPAIAQESLTDPIPAPIENSTIAVSLEPVAEGLTAPLWGTSAPGHPHHLFVVDQPGYLWSIDTRSGDTALVADVSDRLVPLGVFGPGSFDERGFVGAAFDRHFQKNGYLYAYTSEPADGPADFSTMPKGVDPDHHTVISRYQSTDPSNPNAMFDPKSRTVLLTIAQPQFNHNGGALVIDRHNHLFVALGDGGGADDVDGQPFIGGVPIVGHGEGNSQDLTNPLGAILRIDPHGSNSTNGAYGIPKNNPLVGTDAVAEIYAYGFRNPYRISLDRSTGAMWAADVGQNHIEEIDVVRAGGNYGWNLKEGSFVFEPNGNDPGFVTAPADLGTIDPVAEYDHDEGVAVVGGFVYRGKDVPGLQGKYVFGEFAQTFSNDGRLFVTTARSGKIEELLLPHQNGLGVSLLGFGEDGTGELYVLANSTGTPFESTGVVLRIAPGDAKRIFKAHLTGDQEVPAVETDSSGSATLRADARWQSLRFRLSAEDLSGAVAAHIHLGAPGENGPPVAFLFGPSDPTDVSRGLLARGTLTAADLIGPLEGQPLSSLLVALQGGTAYINVHTVASPPGEIRGAIQAR